MAGKWDMSGKRSTAFVVAVVTMLAVAVPFSAPAQATHPTGCTLEVLEEVDTNPSGATHTLTATLFTGSGNTNCTVNTSTSLNVNVDFEVEDGPAIQANCTPGANDVCSGGTSSNDGNSPSTPDLTCDIGTAGGAGTGAYSCQVVFTSAGGGTNIIRAFIDENRNNGGAANATYDSTEGRYAGPTDCGTNLGGAGRSSTESGIGVGERCDFDATTGGTMTAQPGGIGEPDGTDVVQKTWTQALTGNTCIDVDPNDDTNPSGTEHIISATVTTAATRTASTTSDASGDSCSSTSSPGLPREGVQVDFSLNDADTGITGSDDPNAFFTKINGATTNPSGGGPNNVSCITDGEGKCNVTIKTVDTSAVGDNFVIGEVAGQATGGTGGACSNATFTGGSGGTGTGAGNSCTAEVIRKSWASATAATRLDATPEEDTNEVNVPHTITASTANALGTAVAGQTITFDVTAGINSTRDVDGNPSTPAGFIGQCTTGADGTCSETYTSTVVGVDTIAACIDANANFQCDGTEADSGNTTTGDANDDQVTKNWVASGQGASQLALDMEGCNGSLLEPDSPTYEATATPNQVSDDRNDAHAVCARAFSSADAEVRVPVTFTITSGPGRFVAPSSTNASTFEEGSADDLGSSVTVEPGTCSSGASGPGNAGTLAGSTGRGAGSYNCAFLLSESTGSTVVRACVQGSTTVCDTGTKPWESSVQNARVVVVTPDAATNEPGTDHEMIATVTDRFGNGVPGVTITWSRAGAGVIVSQENTTNVDGEAKIVVSSDVEGETTVTATIQGSSTDCDEAANAPANREGTLAGDCTDTASKTWAQGSAAVCNDGIDNDNDGLTDFPDDPGCSSAEDDTETPDDVPATCRGRGAGENVIVGTAGADVIEGTSGRDVICGAGGDDVISARGGNDLVAGNGGDDTIGGGGGKDNLSGNSGNDSVSGNKGNDAVKGQGGNDTLKGNAGIDTLTGGAGADSLQGGAGDDILKGGRGNDSLRGGRGNDLLDGGPGKDSCLGNAGRDRTRRCE